MRGLISEGEGTYLLSNVVLQKELLYKVDRLR